MYYSGSSETIFVDSGHLGPDFSIDSGVSIGNLINQQATFFLLEPLADGFTGIPIFDYLDRQFLLAPRIENLFIVDDNFSSTSINLEVGHHA